MNQRNLGAYRFSLEWSRIEGCRARGLKPMVTFSQFATPRRFAADGGWRNAQAPVLFARFCDQAMRHLGGGISHATPFNDPDILRIRRIVLPPPAGAAASAWSGSARRTASRP